MTADDELKQAMATLAQSIAKLTDLLTLIVETEYNKEDDSN